MYRLRGGLKFLNCQNITSPWVWKQVTNLKLCSNVKLYIASASGSVNGPNPTKSRGAGDVNPWENLILLASFQLAGNCKFKSTPVSFKNFQPQK